MNEVFTSTLFAHPDDFAEFIVHGEQGGSFLLRDSRPVELSADAYVPTAINPCPDRLVTTFDDFLKHAHESSMQSCCLFTVGPWKGSHDEELGFDVGWRQVGFGRSDVRSGEDQQKLRMCQRD